MNVSGHRISTIEVESALVDHHEVAEAAVAARKDATTGAGDRRVRDAEGRRGGLGREARGAAQPRRPEDRADREAGEHRLHAGAAEDAQRQDHAPPAPRRGREPPARRHDDARRPGGRRGDQDRAESESARTTRRARCRPRAAADLSLQSALALRRRRCGRCCNSVAPVADGRAALDRQLAAVVASVAQLGAVQRPGRTLVATRRVAVPVANVWASPGDGRLPNDSHVWPTPAIAAPQRRRARRAHADAGALRRARRRDRRRPAGRGSRCPTSRRRSTARGYPGWVRSWQLGKPLAVRRRRVVVTARRPGSRTGRARLRHAAPARAPAREDRPGATRRRRLAAARERGGARSGERRSRARSSSSACATSGAASRRGASTAPA